MEMVVPAAPGALKPRLERSWSWGESNPRPPGGHRTRYDHSRTPALAATGLAGQWTPKSHRRVFPRCQRSFTPSVVFPYGPSPLLLPGCGDPAPCAIAGHDFALLPTDQIRRRERTAHCWRFIWCPRLTSLKQLGSQIRLPGPNVETSQPHVQRPVYRTPPTPSPQFLSARRARSSS